jgi:hypothetical protein
LRFGLDGPANGLGPSLGDGSPVFARFDLF